MIKFLILICSFFTMSGAVDLYQIQFADATGKTVSMGSFRGKKIIVLVINAKSPDLSYLRYMNQLQAKSKSYQIIAVPSTEFSGLDDPQKMEEVKTKEKLDIIVASAAPLKKSAKGSQHPLLAWITDKEQNQHFDLDVDQTGMLFFINETGILYAVMDGSASPEVINNTLLQVVK